MKKENYQNEEMCCTKNPAPREAIEAALFRLVFAAEELSRYVSGLRDTPLAPPLDPCQEKKGRSSFETFLKQDIVVGVDLATATLNETFLNLQAIIEEG